MGSCDLRPQTLHTCLYLYLQGAPMGQQFTELDLMTQECLHPLLLPFLLSAGIGD